MNTWTKERKNEWMRQYMKERRKTEEYKKKKRGYDKAWRNKHSDKRKEQQRRAREAYNRKPKTALHLLTTTKHRAAKAGLVFSLVLEDVQIPKFCPVLGTPLSLKKGIPVNNENVPSVDRIDSKKGYVSGNVVVVSLRANRLKNDATIEELEKLASFYKKLKPCLTIADQTGPISSLPETAGSGISVVE